MRQFGHGSRELYLLTSRSFQISSFLYLLFSRQFKKHLYSCFLRPVLAYACEIWSTTKGDKEKITCFERRVFRIIYGSVLENKEELMKKYKTFTKNPKSIHIPY